VLSKAGMGKTTTIMQAMNEKGYSQGTHYGYYNAHFTPLAFFNTLDEVNNLKSPKILILDDTELILSDKNIINLIKGATWKSNEQEHRIITYSTTSKKVKNTRINFNGKLILLLNEIPKKNPMFSAILDRSLFVDLKFNNQQILQLIEKEILPKNYQNSSYQQRMKVFKFIRKNCKKETDLSFRTIIKAFNYFLFAPQTWQEMTLCLLKADPTPLIKNNSNLFN
jgi:hypothetical protein